MNICRQVLKQADIVQRHGRRLVCGKWKSLTTCYNQTVLCCPQLVFIHREICTKPLTLFDCTAVSRIQRFSNETGGNDTSIQVIEDPGTSKQVVEDILQDDVVSVVCEGVWYNYHKAVSLIGIGRCNGLVHLFDIENNELLMEQGQLKDIFESKRLIKVMLSCSGDSAWLNNEFNIQLAGVFDTQTAHYLIQEHKGNLLSQGFSLHDMYKKYGSYADVQMEGEEKLWARRPLTEEVILSAAQDARILLPEVYKTQKRYIKENELWSRFEELVYEETNFKINSSQKMQRRNRIHTRAKHILNFGFRNMKTYNLSDFEEGSEIVMALKSLPHNLLKGLSPAVQKLTTDCILRDLKDINASVSDINENTKFNWRSVGFVYSLLNHPMDLVKKDANILMKKITEIHVSNITARYNNYTQLSDLLQVEREILQYMELDWKNVNYHPVVTHLYFKTMEKNFDIRYKEELKKGIRTKMNKRFINMLHLCVDVENVPEILKRKATHFLKLLPNDQNKSRHVVMDARNTGNNSVWKHSLRKRKTTTEHECEPTYKDYFENGTKDDMETKNSQKILLGYDGKTDKGDNNIVWQQFPKLEKVSNNEWNGTLKAHYKEEIFLTKDECKKKTRKIRQKLQESRTGTKTKEQIGGIVGVVHTLKNMKMDDMNTEKSQETLIGYDGKTNTGDTDIVWQFCFNSENVSDSEWNGILRYHCKEETFLTKDVCEKKTGKIRQNIQKNKTGTETKEQIRGIMRVVDTLKNMKIDDLEKVNDSEWNGTFKANHREEISLTKDEYKMKRGDQYRQGGKCETMMVKQTEEETRDFAELDDHCYSRKTNADHNYKRKTTGRQMDSGRETETHFLDEKTEAEKNIWNLRQMRKGESDRNNTLKTKYIEEILSGTSKQTKCLEEILSVKSKQVHKGSGNCMKDNMIQRMKQVLQGERLKNCKREEESTGKEPWLEMWMKGNYKVEGLSSTEKTEEFFREDGGNARKSEEEILDFVKERKFEEHNKNTQEILSGDEYKLDKNKVSKESHKTENIILNKEKNPKHSLESNNSKGKDLQRSIKSFGRLDHVTRMQDHLKIYRPMTDERLTHFEKVMLKRDKFMEQNIIGDEFFKQKSEIMKLNKKDEKDKNNTRKFPFRLKLFAFANKDQK